MVAGSRSLRRRTGDFFCVDDDWDRGGTVEVRDVFTAAAVLALSATIFELMRSVGAFEDVTQPLWLQWVAVVAGALLLVGRRRWPLTVAVLAAAHMFVVGVTMPQIMGQLSLQIVYFVAILSGVAWARHRRDMLVVTCGVVLFMAAWLAWQFALGSGVEQIRTDLGDDAARQFGAIRPVVAAVGLSVLVNTLYFGGAVIGGQVSWRSARQRARLAEQADLITAQGETLRRRAVVEERLRIARELHDVVAHHVSVIGIGAAAARRVLDRDPAAASAALGQIEQSSREAVTQMRGLLGTLRVPDDDEIDPHGTSAASRAPEPGLADLEALVGSAAAEGLTATYRLVEEEPGAAASVPGPVALSVFRTAQESLANVRRHSTASRVTVVVRVQPPSPAGATPSERGGWAEVEVVDDGRPKHGTSGSGLGHLGIRERAVSHRGEVEIGPRATGGYRVRVRLPIVPPTADATGAAGTAGTAGAGR